MTSLYGTVTSHDIHREFEVVTSRGSGPSEACNSFRQLITGLFIIPLCLNKSQKGQNFAKLIIITKSVRYGEITDDSPCLSEKSRGNIGIFGFGIF